MINVLSNVIWLFLFLIEKFVIIKVCREELEEELFILGVFLKELEKFFIGLFNFDVI